MAGPIVVSRQGGEFLVNTGTLGDEIAPRITCLSNGGFVVARMGSSRQGGEASKSGI